VSEKAIQTQILLALGKHPSVRLFRNNTGNGVTGSRYIRIDKPTTVTLQAGDWVVKNGRRIQFGLQVGSGDLIGARQINSIAQFLSVEVKDAKGRLTPDQENWLQFVRKFGGCGIVARSAEEAVSQIVTAELGL
jgi:hypothetical protein